MTWNVNTLDPKGNKNSPALRSKLHSTNKTNNNFCRVGVRQVNLSIRLHKIQGRWFLIVLGLFKRFLLKRPSSSSSSSAILNSERRRLLWRVYPLHCNSLEEIFHRGVSHCLPLKESDYRRSNICSESGF